MTDPSNEEAVTRVARTFRAYRRAVPDHPKKNAGDRLYQEWSELWLALDALQREWPK